MFADYHTHTEFSDDSEYQMEQAVQDAIAMGMDEILETVIADGKGIELNTSYHRYGLKDSMPSVDILRLYRELGFRYFCTYEKQRQKEGI